MEEVMAIRELISKTGRWLSGRRNNIYEPLRKSGVSDTPSNSSGVIARRNEPAADRTEALQMIQNSFEQLVEQLGGINENIGRQIKQNEELIKRIDEIPQLLQNFPESMKNQRIVVDTLVEQLKTQSLKNQQFTEAVEKIPVAAQKQTNAISEMAVQLAASAEIDSQLAEGFRRFNNITDRLNDNVEDQADSINQLSKTFSASDRYLKYIINTQHKRFMWVFITALSISAFAIISLVVMFFLLK
jgi:DNA repair exonuclease SbcCD ATPase subunit